MKKARLQQHHWLWVTEEWDTLQPKTETTLRLIAEAERLGVKNFWTFHRSIALQNSQPVVQAHVMSVAQYGKSDTNLTLAAPSDFNLIHYRVEPPVDHAYWHPLQILCLDEKANVLNPPQALMQMNEKFHGSRIKTLMPPTLVSSRPESIKKFGIQNKVTVLKPLDQAMSRGVELLKWNSTQEINKNFKKISKMSQNFRQPVLLQKYLPGIKKGETRLLFCFGKLIGWARKVPLQGDFIVNIDRGSQVVAHRLTQKEKRAARLIGAELKKQGVWFSAIDLIDGKISDFNITSPGLLIQIEKVMGKNLAEVLIRSLLERRSNR